MRDLNRKSRNSVELTRLGDDDIEADSTRRTKQRSFDPLLHDFQPSAASKKLYSRVSSKLSLTNSQGWHFWCKICAVLSGTVLLVNIILTIWAVSTFAIIDGVGTLQQGKCSRTRTLSLWFHLVINVLGTLLLGASNYCLQCLGSPTRKEIDRAHKQRIALDVGTSSLSNLRRISRPRAISWCLLAISSIPLHLLYNSAIFSEVSTVAYNVFTVSQNFPAGGSFDRNGHNLADYGPQNFAPSTWDRHDFSQYELADQLKSLQNTSSILQNLTKEECMKTYFKDFMSGHGDVLTVSSVVNETDSLLARPLIAVPNINNDEHSVPPFSFICHKRILFPDGSAFTSATHDCTLEASLSASRDWRVQNYTIDYCLSQPVEEHCKLQFSLTIMIIVIVCNLTKLLSMAYLTLKSREEPLVTVGDTISSFLDQPDATTEGLCLANEKTFENSDWKAKPMVYDPQRKFWFHAVSMRRWIASTTILILPIIAAAILLKYALHWTGRGMFTNQELSIAALWRLGFGAVAANSMLNWNFRGSSALVLMALLSNVPQLFLSFLYLTYNGLYTHMLLADEWSKFALHQKPLRVSAPEGQQRSTYRLQLPLRYSIPLLIVSGLIHWVLSQSIFLVRITTYNSITELEIPTLSKYSCGYSCIAIISAIFIGCLMLIAVLANGLRRYETGMPFAGCNSLAVSAACHPTPSTKAGSELMPLIWGAVGDDKSGVGHCCFSAAEVKPPTRGKLYAGMVEFTLATSIS